MANPGNSARCLLILAAGACSVPACPGSADPAPPADRATTDLAEHEADDPSRPTTPPAFDRREDHGPPEPTTAPAGPPEPLPGPRYFDLRYDEDFSYLDGEPGTYRPDFFDPIKNIRLGDDLRVTIGGEFRYRMEAETHTAFGARPRTQDTFQLHRYLLHVDVKYRKLARVFVQGIAAFDEDRDLPPRPTDENRWDLQQLFFDLRPLGEEIPLTVRVGRQDLLYGNERLVSPLDWANTRRRFDAVKLFWTDRDWRFDVWYAKPVVVKPIQGDDWEEDFDFYGAYFTYTGIPRHGIDVYFFAHDQTGTYLNPNGQAGDEDRYTLGSRVWGKTGPVDYEGEIAGQWGHWAGDTVQAWMWTVNLGYTLEPVPWKPRIGAGFDWASGDEKPNDGKVGTFDQLFPLGHKYLGFLDLVGRQNINAVNVNLSAWPVANQVQAAASYYTFWLNAEADALYNAAARPTRRDVTGSAGTEVGHELDLTILWKIDVHSTLLVGYSHFWDTTFITQTGRSEDPDLFYLQYQFRF